MQIVRVKVTQALLALLRRHGIMTSRGGESRWHEGEMLLLDPGARLESYGTIIEGRLIPLALGAFSYSHSAFNTELSVGRYCSLSWGVEVVAGDHPIDWATTSPMTHHPYDMPALAVYLRDRGIGQFQLHRYDTGMKPVVLQNDVWIGMKVLLKRGITVGHGAIIGAGSVVTRDVEPYAIVAGNPARVLRHRFSERVIERLVGTAWWRYGPELVQPLDMRDPEGFVSRLEDRIAAGAAPLDLPVLTGEEIITAGEKIA